MEEVRDVAELAEERAKAEERKKLEEVVRIARDHEAARAAKAAVKPVGRTPAAAITFTAAELQVLAWMVYYDGSDLFDVEQMDGIRERYLALMEKHTNGLGTFDVWRGVAEKVRRAQDVTTPWYDIPGVRVD